MYQVHAYDINGRIFTLAWCRNFDEVCEAIESYPGVAWSVTMR